MTDRVERAAAIMEQAGARVKRDLPLAPLTTFRIGGRASLYMEPDSEKDLAAAARAVAVAGIPYVIIGKGSNILVADEGFSGLVIRLGHGFRWAARDGHRLSAGGAMPLPALAGVALRHGLSGLEFGVAIPATLGGAVVMNAGAHGGEMSHVVEAVTVFRMDHARSEAVEHADLGFSYRHSGIPEGRVVTGASLRLIPGDDAAIRSLMDDARAWRRRTQPLAEPNCGSVFTNPAGDHAARLIEAAGGKALRVNGAAVSQKHANFIVANPGATAADVRALITRVQDMVEASCGIRLSTEVRMIGGPP
ncbi:MAG: UDP-N-acetylmuramate dehydrogenase [Actinomycetota bacterium]|jgi:UDP-N-acetylmuramate dehydrogenase|nr:UDP-N-acetylmuramate dehydrogenase [Actinomycetota bacterium]